MTNKEESYVKDILKVESYQAMWRQKCKRNLSLFEFTPNISLTSQNDDQTVGFYKGSNVESDHTTQIQENVIRSCIDTLSSKIASQKVRPFFNTINGTFKDLKVCKASQQFFDVLYDELDVNKIVVRAFEDSCITDRGIIYINRITHTIERIQPWQFFFNPAEYAYGKMMQCSIKKTDYPTILLDNIKTDLEKVTLHEYWNIKTHKHIIYIEELNKVIVQEWEPDVLPFVILRWANPVKASSSSCVVDLLYGIQRQINYILNQIKDASQSAFGIKYLVPSDSNIKVDRLTNRDGEVITYDPQASQNGSTVPIQTITSPFMDQQWFNALAQFKQDAYEMVGISQLSATSQKPTGLNSGKGLQTLENIEGDRFETQLNAVIRAYTDIAKIAMEIFDPNEEILPNNKYRGDITWADIANARSQMSLQFTSVDKISKDPATKQAIVSQWAAAGWISQAHAAQLMEIPDTENGYSLAQNALNAVLTVIDNCIEKDIYDIPVYIDNQMLKKEITSTCLSLKSANNPSNEADIVKLLKLFDIAISKDKDAMTSAEYAATLSLQQELTQAMPSIQAQVQQQLAPEFDNAMQEMATTIAETESAPSQLPMEEEEATSDETEKIGFADTSKELLALGKKYYSKKRGEQ